MNRRLIFRGLLLLLATGAGLLVLRADLSRWHLARADRLYRSGDLRGAVAAWSSAAIVPASRRQALFNRGSAHYRLGELAAAVSDFREAAASDDRNLRRQALYNLGTTLLVMDRTGKDTDQGAAQKRLNEAVQQLQAAVALNPGNADAVHNKTVAQTRLAVLTARVPTEQQKTPPPRQPQDKEGQSADTLKTQGEPGTAAGKPGAATALDSTAGRRRTVPPLSTEKALRMLDDARGREMLRSGVAAGNRQEKLTPPDKDW